MKRHNTSLEVKGSHAGGGGESRVLETKIQKWYPLKREDNVQINSSIWHFMGLKKDVIFTS